MWAHCDDAGGETKGARRAGRSRAVLRAATLGSVLFATSVAVPAWARQVYPGFIQKELRMQCAPSCLLCHTCMEGGLGCMKPSDMTDAGLPDLGGNRGQGEFFANLLHVNYGSDGKPHWPADETMLRAYLTSLEKKPCSANTTSPCDSDGDLTLDVAELRRDSDPDVPDKAGDACYLPKYGCGANVAPLPSAAETSARAAGVLALFGCALVLARRRRR